MNLWSPYAYILFKLYLYKNLSIIDSERIFIVSNRNGKYSDMFLILLHTLGISGSDIANIDRNTELSLEKRLS